MKCNICPRECGTDRTVLTGYCGANDTVTVALSTLHHFEEPCISGTNGSGAIFFSHCPLRCCFCQNRDIATGGHGKAVTLAELAQMMLDLQAQGAHNINLVTPTHYSLQIASVLRQIKPQLKIPIVYNCGGYEKVETLKLLSGLVDIYLPDLKYMDNERAMRYSTAADYVEVATRAIRYMADDVGSVCIGEDGLLKSGVIIRHLILPKGHKDSLAVINWVSETFAPDEVLLSLMSQYTPYGDNLEHPELNRKIYSYEYNKVVDLAAELAIKGYMQDKSSAIKDYTPDFLGNH